MKKFSELPFLARLAMMLGLATVIVLGGEYLYLGAKVTENAGLSEQVTKLQDDNKRLAPFELQLKQKKAENEQLERDLANLWNIVPEEKEADGFIRLVQQAGVQAGINIRSFVAKPVVQRELYAEMPFDLSLDGSFYSVLQFFDRMAKMGRISNVSNLAMGPTEKGSVRNVPRHYKYGSGETVIASCTATTFFAKEQSAPAAKK